MIMTVVLWLISFIVVLLIASALGWLGTGEILLVLVLSIVITFFLRRVPVRRSS